MGVGLLVKPLTICSCKESSQIAHVISGVPQGSVPSHLLFLIYVDDVADASLPNGSLILYVDDILLFVRLACKITISSYSRTYTIVILKFRHRVFYNFNFSSEYLEVYGLNFPKIIIIVKIRGFCMSIQMCCAERVVR